MKTVILNIVLLLISCSAGAQVKRDASGKVLPLDEGAGLNMRRCRGAVAVFIDGERYMLKNVPIVPDTSVQVLVGGLPGTYGDVDSHWVKKVASPKRKFHKRSNSRKK
jgi:hypothetical protein